MVGYSRTGVLLNYLIISTMVIVGGFAATRPRRQSSVYFRESTGRSTGIKFQEDEEHTRWPTHASSVRQSRLVDDSSWGFSSDRDRDRARGTFSFKLHDEPTKTGSFSDTVRFEDNKKYSDFFGTEARSKLLSFDGSEETSPDIKSKEIIDSPFEIRHTDTSGFTNNVSSKTTDNLDFFKASKESEESPFRSTYTKSFGRQSKVFPIFDSKTPDNFEFPKSEEEQGRYLSPDTIDTISETLGAINTVGRYLVNYTRGSTPDHRLDVPPARQTEDVPGALLTISKNVLGRNVTNSIAPLVRVLPIAGAKQPAVRSCTTPTGKTGSCEDLSNCPQLLLDLTNLRQSICFVSLFVPGVCCPRNGDSNTGISSEGFTTTKRPPLILTTSRPVQIAASQISLTTTTYRPNDLLVDNTFTSGSCGKQDVPRFRVVGGEEALPGRWPWMAAIFLHGPRRTEFWCGGSLIGSKYILTAAHCTKDTRQRPFQARQFTVRLGDIDLRREDEPSSPQTYHVAEVRAHPRFSRVGFYNDIAVLVLDRPVKKSQYVIPVCLPPGAYRSELFIGEQPTVIGWGTTYYGGKESTIQRQVALPVWKNEDCDRTYFQPINENFICAGVKEGGKDACQGDSGGPLILKKNGRWMQIGIVSFGNKCGEPGYPGVYTRVTQYIDWIRSNTIN